jgi:hypothetical protein
MSLTNKDFENAGSKIGVEPAKIRAVDEIESLGSGFLENGEPKILFEAHWFHKLTDGEYTEDHSNISSRRWDRSLYEGGQAEHDRLQKAVKLDREAALQSASWGRYQIMGFNWDKCGYESLQKFINAMYRSEADHLDAFVEFIKSEDIVDELRESDWHGFARVYNGPGYKKNHYAERMKESYEKFRD